MGLHITYKNNIGGPTMNRKNSKLLKTNLLISIILIFGFAITAIFSYRANYQVSLNNVEQVSSLSADGIYYQMSSLFSKPINISLTMAHDSLLIDHINKERTNLKDSEYILTVKKYLEAYQKKYDFDSVFLVSAASGRYYNFNGLDRVLTKENPENEWYYSLLDSAEEYSLNVDNDEVTGADNVITTFVNCKIQGPDGRILGVVGVGIRMDYLKELLKGYEDKFDVRVSLINKEGDIEISTSYTGYEKKNWFDVYGQEDIKSQVLNWNDASKNLELWTSNADHTDKSYVVSRYIPELSWNLIVEQETGQIVHEMKMRLYQSFFIIMLVILLVLVIITTVIRNFNGQIVKLVDEHQMMFKKATEELYDSIYELNLTKNCYVGEPTEKYFSSLGAGKMPFDEGLRVIAKKQIKEEFREGYVQMFTPKNAIREFESGNNHLSYDFMITEDGINYHWTRVETYLFFSQEDQSVHMFSYRKNIDSEKKKELMAKQDGMTGFYTKITTETLIQKQLSEHPENRYAFIIFDIDNFKQINDRYGHAFGDYCITCFTQKIRRHFRESDILGRIGGDEFAAFLSVPSEDFGEEKARELSKALDMECVKDGVSCHLTASIGIAFSSLGQNFENLYRCADAALYQTKENGKNGFTIYHERGAL